MPNLNRNFTFGSGTLLTQIGAAASTAYSVKFVNGKIILVGDSNGNFTIARYNLNGSLDSTFGVGGIAIADFLLTESAQGVVIQPDGKIVVAGTTGTTSGSDIAIARFTADGVLDTTFDTDGRATYNIGNIDFGYSIALQSDGRIVVAGSTNVNGGTNDVAVIRVLSTGALDTTFDTDGRLTTNTGGVDEARSVVVQPDGKILVAGTNDVGVLPDFSVVRYNFDGSLDTTFATGGIGDIGIGLAESSFGMALQSDGKILLVGSTTAASSSSDFAMLRLNANGTRDTAFGTNGQVITDFGAVDTASGVVVQPDGKILVAGYSVSASGDFSIARYNSNGTLDTTFDGDGKVSVNILADRGYSLDLQPDGRIVIGGRADAYFAMVRLRPDGSLDTPAANDFNRNGASDVLLQNGGTVVDWLMGGGSFQSGNVITNGAIGFSVAGKGDFDNDGDADIVLQNGSTVVAWIMQNGAYQTGNAITNSLPAGWSIVGTGDFNFDGDDDLLVQNGGTIVAWSMQSGAFQSGSIITTGAAGFTVVGTGDFDGDGDDDVVLQNGGTIVTWTMQNGAYQSGSVITSGAAGFTVVGTGDLDGDGDSDIVLQGGGTVVDWIMHNGAYQVGNVVTAGLPAGWSVVDTGDYNSDGVSDLLLQSGGTIANWTMQNGLFQSGSIVTTGAFGFLVV